MALSLKTMNEEQKRAVTHEEGPLLIVAGAGTGKTTVITQRIGWIIEQEKAKTNEILALTFTDKAAGEMEERVDQVLPYGYVDLWIMTFHAFAEKILQQHALEIGIPNDFKLLNQTEQWMLVRQNLDRFNLDYYKPLGNPTKFIHALLKLFSRAKDEAIAPAQYLEYVKNLKLNTDAAEFLSTQFDAEIIAGMSKSEQKELLAQEISKQEEIANAYHVYQQLLLEHNALDFGDLINYCLQLFKQRPAVLAKYRQQFKYILVDEFQDTNHAQYELVQLLAAPRNNITVVGDDDQSIYKFRGASVSNILEFIHDYPKATEVFLTTNYRSKQIILDWSYKFITQNNPDRLEVKLEQVHGKKLSKKLTAQAQGEGNVVHQHYQSVDDEIKGVLTQIDKIKKDEKINWSDFAILARTNDVANLFAHALSQTNIPYLFIASKGLYTKEIILNMIAYLRLLDDYHENSAVYRVLHSPFVGIDHKTLVGFNYWAKRKGYSIFSTLQSPEALRSTDRTVKEKVQKFLQMVERHTALAKRRSVAEVLVTALEESGYLESLTKVETVSNVQAASYLNQLMKKITAFERASEDRSVKRFLDLIDLELEAGEEGSLEQDLEEGPDSVKVMTVHAAKGLEFKHVFVVSLVDRRFPTDNRPDPILIPEALIKETLPEGDAHLQEERRLFYVAMTRAKDGLYLTSASDYGGSRKKKISRFLQELSDLGFTLNDLAGVEVGKLQRGISEPVVTNRDVAYLIPKRFSFTQLNSFNNCPYHYWLEFILKIPQKGKSFFSFGSTLHGTLQKFFLLASQRIASPQQDLFGSSDVAKGDVTKPLVSKKELFELYDQNWIDDWYPNRTDHDSYKQKGHDALENFYATYEKELPLPQLLEQPFSLHVTDPDTKEAFGVLGKIDRIDAFEDGVEIIDYKTGQGKTQDSLDADGKRQLMIYQLAAEQQLGLKVKKLTYYYLETGVRVSFMSTPKEVAALQDWIIKTIRAIRSYPFPPSPEDCTCYGHDLRNL